MAGNRLNTDTILKELSIPDAPVRRKGIETAVPFFQTHRKSRQDIYRFLKAMDLSKPVRLPTLKLNTILIGYRNRKHGYGEFYTVSGTSPNDVGINPTGRAFILYRVHTEVEALESTASSYAHICRGKGGAVQYFIPLEVAKQSLENWRIGQREQA